MLLRSARCGVRSERGAIGSARECSSALAPDQFSCSNSHVRNKEVCD